MKAGKKVVCWDTAVWLAWLLGERQWPDTVLAGIEDVILDLEKGRLLLMTSSITRSEVFEGRLTPVQKNLWTSILRRSDVHAIAADDRVNDRASQIREYHASRGVKLLTPDAIHLATAVLYKADEFQTMDGLDKSGKPKRILALDGDVGGYPLFVTHPYPRSGPPTQRHLFLAGTLPPQDAAKTQIATVKDLQNEPKKEEGAKGNQNTAGLPKDPAGRAGDTRGKPQGKENKDS